jgi:hypothetical protein
MRPLLFVCAGIAWAAAAGGCGSGTAGPASPPFDPFGNETITKTGDEPVVSGIDPGPGNGGQSIAQLCAIDCVRIEAACPGGAGDTCVSSCSAVPSRYPQCTTEAQAYLACVATAPLGCSGGTVDTSACDDTGIAFSQCANAAGTSAGGSAP